MPKPDWKNLLTATFVIVTVGILVIVSIKIKESKKSLPLFVPQLENILHEATEITRESDLIFTFSENHTIAICLNTGKVTIIPEDVPLDSITVIFWKAIETRFETENRRLRARIREMEK